jgi:hypothetical protein
MIAEGKTPKQSAFIIIQYLRLSADKNIIGK